MPFCTARLPPARRTHWLPAKGCLLQCQLLTEVCDAELEEELQDGATPVSRLSLTQVSCLKLCSPLPLP